MTVLPVLALLATLCLSLTYGRMLLDIEDVSMEAPKGGYKFCDTPTRKNKVNFPTSIIGRAANGFEMYSGYINVTTSPDYLFYWFFGTQDGNANAPLIVWTNGGPGCTAMEGATTEHGPLSLFDIKESCTAAGNTKCDYTGQFSTNPYAWNKHANVLYLDQPRNVGYSFGYGLPASTSVAAGNDFVTFYNEWLTEFPEFVGRDLIISGESYGGHFIPAFANAILNYNDANTRDPIPFKGAIIGNGCVNDTVQGTSAYVQFQHEQNLIPTDSNPLTQAAAQKAMTSHIGYTPNYYDYRIQSITCTACYGYNYTAWSYWFLQTQVETALNVCGEAGNDAFAGSAGGCISIKGFDSNDKFDYSGALARTLDAGIPVTLYYGKTDTACNYVGGLQMANTISWNGKDSFNAATFQPLNIAEVEVGQLKSSGGLSFVQIESAGHMVPMDQPAAAYAALNTVLSQLKK